MEKDPSSVPYKVFAEVFSDIDKNASDIKDITKESNPFIDTLQFTMRTIGGIYQQSNPNTTVKEYNEKFLVPAC